MAVAAGTQLGPYVVADQLGAGGMATGAAQYAVSETGTLVYATGGVHPQAERELQWVGRDGTGQALPLPPAYFLTPSLSPDGSRIAYRDVWEDKAWTAIWVRDLARLGGGPRGTIPATARPEGPGLQGECGLECGYLSTLR